LQSGQYNPIDAKEHMLVSWLFILRPNESRGGSPVPVLVINAADHKYWVTDVCLREWLQCRLEDLRLDLCHPRECRPGPADTRRVSSKLKRAALSGTRWSSSRYVADQCQDDLLYSI